MGVLRRPWRRAAAQFAVGALVAGSLTTIGFVAAGPATAATGSVTVDTTLLNFGDIPLGTASAPQFVTVTNTGHSAVTVTGSYVTSGPFQVAQVCRGANLLAGSSCEMSITFRPDTTAPASGFLAGVWNGRPFAITLIGNHGPQFSITPTAFDFGDVPLNTRAKQQTVTIKNLGPTAVVMSGAGGGAGVFGGQQDCQGLTLAVGATCHMFYAFTPGVLGPLTGSTGGNWNQQNFGFSFKGNGINRFRISPTAFDFGDVKLGTTAPTQKVTITNVGPTPVVMSGAGGGAGIFGGQQDCQGLTLAPGKSCHMSYAFRPTSLGAAVGNTGGNWNGQPFSFSFKGNAVAGASVNQFRISPTAFDFGDVPLGSVAAQQTVTITNIGSAAVVMNGAGGGAGIFGGQQDCQGLTIKPGQSCHMFYAFRPTAHGAQTGSTGGNWNGQIFSFAFKGNAINQFLISPTAFDFGNVKVGTTSAQQKVTITNVGSAAVVMNGAGGGAGQFGGQQDCEGLTIAAGKSCAMFYAFRPTAVGAQTGTTGGNWNEQTFSFAFKGQAT